MVIKQPHWFAAITVVFSFVSALQLGDFFASFKALGAYRIFSLSAALFSLLIVAGCAYLLTRAITSLREGRDLSGQAHESKADAGGSR